MSPTRPPRMPLAIDHVTIAWSRLEALERAFAGVGLAADYGGPHGNRATHMDVLGFDDGSYVELIAPFEPGAPPMAWEAQMAGDGGPCAWCVRVADISAEIERLRAAGIPVEGPLPSSRTRPDGTRVEWEFAFPGPYPRGAVLPFMIQDKTPRELRVRPSASVAGTELTGVAAVLIGVSDLNASVALFRAAYGWPEPEEVDATELDSFAARPGARGMRLAVFPGAPVVLADPTPVPTVSEVGRFSAWLADRVDRFGPSPFGYLLGTRDLEATRRRLPLNQTQSWFERAVAWVEPERVLGLCLGVVAVEG